MNAKALAGREPRARSEPQARNGRSAASRPTTPERWLPRRWQEILLRVCREIFDDRILANAAGVTFYALLALFPAIAALVSIYGLFADPASIAKQLDEMSDVLPGGGIAIIRDQLTRLTSQSGTTLGIGFIAGLCVSLWSANGAIKALFGALNVVYAEEEKRSFFKITAVSLLFTLGMIGFLVAALSVMIAVPASLEHLPGAVGTLIALARWPVLLVLVAVALVLIYRYGPSRDEPHWRWGASGSVFAAIAWLAASALFSWYGANFGSFDRVYGSLGAIIGFMIWMWLSNIVILFGGKLNAAAEHQTRSGDPGAAANAPK